MHHRPTILTLALIITAALGLGLIVYCFVGPFFIFFGPLGLLVLFAILLVAFLLAVFRALRPKM